MPMNLLDKQQYFMRLLSMLISFTYEKGYRLTIGPAWHAPGPTPRYTGDPHPMTNDCHAMRLAIDLNLFVDGEWIEHEHPAFHEIGTYWKSLDPMCMWGGDFEIRDYDHFSLTHLGFS